MARNSVDRAFAGNGPGAVAVASGSGGFARLACRNIGSVEARHGGEERRRILGRVAHFSARNRRVAKQRIGKNLLHLAGRMFALALHEVAGIYAIDAG